MRNEDILLAAQKEKSVGKEFENKTFEKSNLLGALVAIILGMSLFSLEYFIKGSVNVGLIAVGMGATGSQSLYEGIKPRKAFLIIIGIVELIIALMAIIAFLNKVVTE